MATLTFTPQTAMRITSMAILGYDYIVTIPSEIRLYKRQRSMLRPSIACVLFMMARYVGLAYSCWVTAIFFGTTWTESSCTKLAFIGALLRGWMSSTSAAVFVWRTWAIWGKPRWVLISMGIVLIPTTFFSYVPGLAQRGVMSGSGGCTAVARGDGPLAAKWTFALVNLIFDTVACVLGSIKLILNRRNGNSVVSNILLADGLLYFVIAVAVQATNLIFLLSPVATKQGTFLTFQTVTTSILAQRIITSLSERTSTISTGSNHDSTNRTRERSASRSLSVFKRSGPNPMPIRTFQRDGSGQDLEMMKVEVTVASQVHTDGDSATGVMPDDRKIMYAA